jgi:phage terminase small subunit
MKPLSNRHIAFIEEYMQNGRNATAAYASIYTKASRKTAESNGFLLLQKTEIKEELEKRESILREKNKISLESLSQQLMDIALSAAERHPSASVAAIKLLTELHGLNKENESPTQETGPQEITIKIVKSKNNEKENNND